MGNDVRPAFVKSIKISSNTGIFGGNIEGEINVFRDFFGIFFPATEETSEALSSNIFSASERCKSFRSLSSGSNRVAKRVKRYLIEIR